MRVCGIYKAMEMFEYGRSSCLYHSSISDTEFSGKQNKISIHACMKRKVISMCVTVSLSVPYLHYG